jgi:hypothetical protein
LVLAALIALKQMVIKAIINATRPTAKNIDQFTSNWYAKF